MTMDLDYEFRPAFTLMTANLGPGESIKVEPGAMVAQSYGLDMQTGMSGGGGVGGFLKSMAKSALGGESFWLNTFTAGSSGGWISMAPSTPGDISTFDIEPGRNLFMQGGAFMACSPNVQYDTKFQGLRSLGSREGGFFLRAFSEGGPGQVFYCAYGAIKEDFMRDYGEAYEVNLTNPDFVRYAEAFGAVGMRATPDELGPTLRRAVSLDKPSIIEVPVQLHRPVKAP